MGKKRSDSQDKPVSKNEPSNPAQSGSSSLFNRRNLLIAALVAAGGGAAHHLSTQDDLPAEKALKEMGYKESDLRLAEQDYKTIKDFLTRRQQEAKKKSKPFCIVLGEHHESQSSLYYKLMVMKAAKSLGIDHMGTELDEVLHNARMSGATESPVGNRFYAEAKNNGFQISPTDTFFTYDMRLETQKKSWDATIEEVKKKKNLTVQYDHDTGAFRVSADGGATWMPSDDPRAEEVSLLQSEHIARLYDAINPTREQVMVNNMASKKIGFGVFGNFHLEGICKHPDMKPYEIAIINAMPNLNQHEMRTLSSAKDLERLKWANDKNNGILVLPHRDIPSLDAVGLFAEYCASKDKVNMR